MKSTSLENVQAILTHAIKTEVFPGVSLAIVDRGQVEYLSMGHLRSNLDHQKVRADTIYDLASITKLITAILALQLIEDDKLSLDDKLDQYLTATKDLPTGKLTIWQLLTSLPNFTYALSDHKDLDGEKLLEFIFQANWSINPQKEIIYTNTAFILLGLAIEQVVGVSLDQLADSKIFLPLHMSSTKWGTLPSEENIAPSEIDKWRKLELVGQIHDESAWKLDSDLRLCVGSAGVFSNIKDCTKLLWSLLNPDDHTLLTKATKLKMMANQLLDYQLDGGFGIEKNRQWMGQNKARLLGKTGFTGTMMVWDVEVARGLIMLSNATYPHRPTDRTKLMVVRQQLCDTVFET